MQLLKIIETAHFDLTLLSSFDPVSLNNRKRHIAPEATALHNFPIFIWMASDIDALQIKW